MKIKHMRTVTVLRLTHTEYVALCKLADEGAAGLLDHGYEKGYWDNKREYNAGARVCSRLTPRPDFSEPPPIYVTATPLTEG